MFMKNIMYKTKYLSDFLQKKDVEVSAASIIMQATKKFIEVIRGDKAADSSQITSTLIYAKTLGIDGETEFAKVQRLRKLPWKLEENRDNVSSLNLKQFCRKEFNLFLDLFISVLNTKCDVLENTIKIFTDVLDPNAKIYEGLKKQVPKPSF